MNKVINRLAKIVNTVTGQTIYFINMIPATGQEFYLVMRQSKVIESTSSYNPSTKTAKYQYNLGVK